MARNPFRRAVPVPSEVMAAASLPRGEKVLAGARADADGWLLGTRSALYIVKPVGEARIPWERIERADWDRDGERLLVTEVGEYGSVRPQHVFAVDEPGLLLELVRERVTASIVVQRRVRTHGKRGLFVIGRRAPGGTGEVAWAYEFDDGVDPQDPDVMAAAVAGLRTTQADLGL